MTTPKKTSPTDSAATPLEEHLRRIAKEAAGRSLSESLADGAPLADLIGRFVEIALEEELTEHLGYPPNVRGGRSTARGRTTRGPSEQGEPNTRNGRSAKTLKTTHGPTEIAVPRDRQGTFDPQIVPKHRSITADVEARVVAMYAQGMTTREIQRHVTELYHFEASEMLVSRLVERLEPELAAWRSRELEPVYAIVFIDAVHSKVRHSTGAQRGVRSTALYTVSAYNEAGQHEVLGVYAGSEGEHAAESASVWHQVLLDLEDRGAQDLLVVTSDGLSGLESALQAVFPKATHLPCVVHLMRQALRPVPYARKRAVARALKAIYQAPTPEAAERALQTAEDTCGAAAVQGFRAAWPRLAELWRFGAPLRRLVYTTNPIENLHRQLRKVTKNRSVFPSVDSALRLATLVLRDIDHRNRSKGTRPDWTRIVSELHLVFPNRLPRDWGRR
jgi:transposase-like protein